MSTKANSAAGHDFAVDLEFSEQGMVKLDHTQPGQVAKCSISVFLDEPQPGSATVYVELVTLGLKQVELVFHDEIDAVEAVQSNEPFYRDDLICQQLIRHFHREAVDVHSQSLTSDASPMIQEITCEVVSGGGSNQDAFTRDLVRMRGDATYQGTWLRWSWHGRTPIIGHSPARVQCRVRARSIKVDDVHFWVFLPRDYTPTGEECVVRDGMGLLAVQVGHANPVDRTFIGSDYPLWKSFKELAANKTVLHNKDPILLAANHNVRFSLDCVSQKWSTQERRQTFFAGVLVSVSASLLANCLFYGATGQANVWLTAGVAVAALAIFEVARRQFWRSTA